MKTLTSLAVASVSLRAASLDADAITKEYFGNDSAWYSNRIPLFESSASEIQDVYYYRWNVFRAHQRDLGSSGYISTEFIEDVSWQVQPYALLINAANFHLREGRWCRDRRFKNDYAAFLYGPNGNPYQFSESMADGVYQGYLVDGVVDDATVYLDAMQKVFKGWNSSMDIGGYDTSKGLYWIQPLTDATEYTISSIDASGGEDGFMGGFAFRPSINSYQYANAMAISKLAKVQGNEAVATDYEDQAKTIKKLVQDSLWNSTFEQFVDRYKQHNEHVTYWDFIRGRELVGYVPWTHDLPDDREDYAQAWKHLLDSDKLAGSHGLRTNEPSYEYYMHQYRYEGDKRECQWNGPAWPYQTTQALTALANLLDHYPIGAGAGIISKADYTHILTQYAKLHYNPIRGGLNLEEDYDADTGHPIVGLDRSPHYFHSGYIDQILSGFVGIRPREDDVLEVNPLADPASVSYFRAERILYHGQDVGIQWDATGTKYGQSGLIVEIDSEPVATARHLTRLTIPVTRKPPPSFDNPLAVSIQLASSSEYPKGSVSVPDANADKVHSAVDGRVWFFPDASIANGWDSPAGAGNGSEVWYEIDFGAAVKTGSAEIAFFANVSQGFDVPGRYWVQINESGKWRDVANPRYGNPMANGITRASWDMGTVDQIRLVFRPQDQLRVRLVEFKVFGEVVRDYRAVFCI